MYRNPVFNHDAADPTVIRGADGIFHCFTTQSLYDERLVNMPHLVSSDLVNWRLYGDAMPALPSWVAGSVWAPHIHNGPDGYLLYYCAQVAGREDHAIGVQRGSSLVEPFVDRGSPLITRTDDSESTFSVLDPFSLVTADDKRYLYWGSGHAPIRVQELSVDGLSLRGPVHEVLRAGRSTCRGSAPACPRRPGPSTRRSRSARALAA